MSPTSAFAWVASFVLIMTAGISADMDSSPSAATVTPTGVCATDASPAPPSQSHQLATAPPDDDSDSDADSDAETDSDSNSETDADADSGRDRDKPRKADEEADGDSSDAGTDESDDDDSADAAADESDREKGGEKKDRSSGESESAESEDKKTNEADEDEKNDEDESVEPQVEVFIPSMTRLVEKAKASRTGALFNALSGALPKIRSDSDDGFDFDALVGLLDRVAAWPDTSVALTAYPQDREGRPRWALRLDWSLDDLLTRVREILEDDAAAAIFKDVELKEADDGWRIELPDMVLAVLKSNGDGSFVTAQPDLTPPEKLFGEKSAKKGASLVYCRLNLGAVEEDGESIFQHLSGVSDVRYAGNVDGRGEWRERFNVRWNPFLGTLLKTAFQKTNQTFDCPSEALAAGVFHLGIAEGLADSLAGLPMGTIGSRADGEMAFVVLPGEGFFPFPEMYYQFRARRVEKIAESIRESIEKDDQNRRADDRPPAWHEETIDDGAVFWHDPSVDNGGTFSLVTFRTVVFFSRPDEEDDGGDRLIVAQTSGWADDAVDRWREAVRKRKSRITLPTSDKAHWQLIVNWRTVYELVEPYVTILTGLSEDATPPPSVEAMDDVLSDSVVNVRVLYTGLDVRHRGPLPIGAGFVPGVVAASLAESASPGSEAAREQVACRNLRVLYHHSKLFRDDFGRWPATVAELDGYVDFASYPYLLSLRPKDDGFLKGFVAIFTTDKEALQREQTIIEEDDQIDDSLYEIDWSPEAWKLKYRPGEFHDYTTIYIDQDGEIHRVPKDGEEPDVSPGDDKEPRRGRTEKLARRAATARDAGDPTQE